MSSVPNAISRPSRIRRGALWLAISVTAGCIGFSILYFCQPPTPALSEAEPEELVRREERCYRKDEDRPFTGYLVERHPDGALKARSAVLEGVLNGSSEGWYANGQIEVREQQNNGMLVLKTHAEKLKGEEGLHTRASQLFPISYSP
jgi:hypothetical protein